MNYVRETVKSVSSMLSQYGISESDAIQQVQRQEIITLPNGRVIDPQSTEFSPNAVRKKLVILGDTDNARYK